MSPPNSAIYHITGLILTRNEAGHWSNNLHPHPHQQAFFSAAEEIENRLDDDTLPNTMSNLRWDIATHIDNAQDHVLQLNNGQ